MKLESRERQEEPLKRKGKHTSCCTLLLVSVWLYTLCQNRPLSNLQTAGNPPCPVWFSRVHRRISRSPRVSVAATVRPRRPGPEASRVRSAQERRECDSSTRMVTEAPMIYTVIYIYNCTDIDTYIYIHTLHIVYYWLVRTCSSWLPTNGD